MSCSSSSSEEEKVVVIDLGSGFIKAGFAGDDGPRSYLPSCIKNISHTNICSGAEAAQDLTSLRYPIERGIVTDWDDAQKVIDSTFKDLKVDPSDVCVLMSEPPLNPLSNREKWTHLMFESFNVNGFFMTSSATLAIFAYGRSAGMIVDIGEGVTFASPQIDVFTVPNAVQRQDFAGRDLTHILQKLLYNNGLTFNGYSELKSVRKMKEKLCITASDIEKESVPFGLSPDEFFTLPDGKVIDLKKERFQCAEALFDPVTYADQNLRGLHELVYDCFMSLDSDLRNSFYCNILLTGGTSCMLGLPERLQAEMVKLLPSKKVTRVVAAPERKYSVWVGGSILGSLSMFQGVPMTKQEYEEFGPSIVRRKFH